jgi:hypothetical protein
MGRGALDDSIAPSNVLGQQIGSFAGSPFSEILDGLPVAVIVLNAFGQIVYSNPAFEILIGNEASSEMLGTRLGEALGCIHCRGRNIRCGITDFCRYCGGSVSFLSSSGGNTRIEECRITRTRNGREESLDLKVWSKTLSHSGEDFVLSCLIDASDEKRRRVLERAFFHDILNIASGLKVTYDVLLKDTLPAAVKEKITALGAGTQQLVEEIQLQKDLTAAEKNQLLPHWECFEAGYRQHGQECPGGDGGRGNCLPSLPGPGEAGPVFRKKSRSDRRGRTAADIQKILFDKGGRQGHWHLQHEAPR